FHSLPTDIQAESIPLILGGGDVLMAFSIPVIQIVYETLKDQQEGKKGRTSIKTGGAIFNNWQMNPYDRSTAFAIGPDGLCCQSREFKEWHGCRSTKGVTKGKYYYEVTCSDQGLCRVGWSTSQAALDLGTDKYGFGFGGTGKKSNNKQFDSYGEEFTMHDTIGCYLDMDKGQIYFSKNGNDLGLAFDVPQNLKNQAFFASCVLKNAELKFNFGGEDFKHPPKTGFIALDQAADGHTVKSAQTGSAKVSQVKASSNAPKALIIEPSKELAEQTLNNVTQFKKYVDDPKLRSLLVIGGVAAKDQLAALDQGVDIVVGTPGRLDDLISTGKLSLSQVRFLVLDECDGLLSAGYTDFINRIHNQIPQVTSDGKRLQVIVCSATLHSFDVKKLSERIMHFPTWVDLKGEDSVPETVHHVVVPVNPKNDRLWERLGKNHIRVSPQKKPGKMWSEAVKVLKGEYTVRAIKEHKMDQAIVFCRTKIDCDNMEQYFIQQGGGPDSKGHQLSCVCLHGDRKPNERKNNLERFKVWYHVCANRGRGCYNTRLKEDGGCTIWYNEKELLSDIEEHLKCTITQCEPDIKVPVDEFDGKVTYGQRRALGGGNYKGHVDVLAPTVQELANLEREAQTSFLHLGYLPNQLFRAF
uniref:ATP-dependent RNA helicase n=1 Tax=Amphiprion ocellaris TaxID=80972 RepID=A0AAQ5YT15_AMPOC